MEKPNIWCVTGVPGSGKSTLSQQLLETGDFQIVESDEYSRRFYEQMDLPNLERLYNVGNFENYEAYLSQVSRSAGILRKQFEKVFSLANIPGFETAKNNEPYLRLLYEETDLGLINEFFTQPRQILSYLSILITKIEALERSVEIAALRRETVLLVDNTLVGAVVRKAVSDYFKAKDINPGLLIVQGVFSRLVETARQRRGEILASGDQVFVDRGNEALIRHYDKYHQKEGWENVLVVRRSSVDEDLDGVRQKLLGQVDLVNGPIEFVTDA
ncbi:MAG: AAA family ATPase [Patescibacteria group bacterium]